MIKYEYFEEIEFAKNVSEESASAKHLCCIINLYNLSTERYTWVIVKKTYKDANYFRIFSALLSITNSFCSLMFTDIIRSAMALRLFLMKYTKSAALIIPKLS